MYYIYLKDNTVLEIIPDVNPAFLGIPIMQRYSSDFLNRCITSDDASTIHAGMIYDPEAKTFSEPPVPEPVLAISDLEPIRTAKLAELDAAAQTAITAGCDVTLTNGTTGRISLTTEDQINLSTAQAAVQAGATGYPCHLDGQLCAVYAAADINIMAKAATQHILYHTTLCNHLLIWARRCTAVAEVQASTYGAVLPDDLKTNMEAIINAITT